MLTAIHHYGILALGLKAECCREPIPIDHFETKKSTVEGMFTWFLRARAFNLFGYDPDHVFSDGPHDELGFAGMKCVVHPHRKRQTALMPMRQVRLWAS